MTTAGAGNDSPLPLKGVQLPAQAPASPSPFRLRPQAGAKPGGCPHKAGKPGSRDPGRAGSPRPRVLSPRRRLAGDHPSDRGPGLRTPPAPGTGDEAGSRLGKAAGDLPRAPGQPWPPREDSNSRRPGPRGRASAMLPGKVGPPGPGAARRPRARARGGESESGSYRAPHARPLPRGRWGRAAGEGRGPAAAAAAAGPARWRGGAAGRREAEKARRGRLPSGGRREMQLSLRSCRRGHKWGRAGRSGVARAAGLRLRHPQTLFPGREAGIGVGKPMRLRGIRGKGLGIRDKGHLRTLGQSPLCIPARIAPLEDP